MSRLAAPHALHEFLAPPGTWMAERTLDGTARNARDLTRFTGGPGRLGFTLLEVVIALTAASLVALLLHRGLREVRVFTRRAHDIRAAAAHDAAVRRQLVSWLRGVYVAQGPPRRLFEMEPSTHGGAEGDRLRFWTSARSWGRSGALQVTLKVEPSVGLVATIADRTGTTTEVHTVRTVLVPGARSLVVRSFVPGEGERGWVRAWTSSGDAPAAIELRIVGEGVPPMLGVPVLVARGR